jgi:hypothetical protein
MFSICNVNLIRPCALELNCQCPSRSRVWPTTHQPTAAVLCVHQFWHEIVDFIFPIFFVMFINEIDEQQQ